MFITSYLCKVGDHKHGSMEIVQVVEHIHAWLVWDLSFDLWHYIILEPLGIVPVVPSITGSEPQTPQHLRECFYVLNSQKTSKTAKQGEAEMSAE